MIKAILFDWIASKWAFSKLPAAGQELGLKHKKSHYLKEFGELQGKINGRRVSIKPENSINPIIRVNYLNIHKGLEISLSKPHHRRHKSVTDFKTNNWKFNRSFKTLRIRKDMVSRVKNDKEFSELIISFYTKWIFRLESFIIGDDDIFCSLRYGYNFFPHIPPAKLKELITELLVIAEKIDSLMDKR